MTCENRKHTSVWFGTLCPAPSLMAGTYQCEVNTSMRGWWVQGVLVEVVVRGSRPASFPLRNLGKKSPGGREIGSSLGEQVRV